MKIKCALFFTMLTSVIVCASVIGTGVRAEGNDVVISEENFPDPVLREIMEKELDKNGDHILDETEKNPNVYPYTISGVSDLKGLELIEAPMINLKNSPATELTIDLDLSSLYIEDCDAVKKIKIKRAIPDLSFINCEKLTDIEMNNDVRQLHLSRLPSISEFDLTDFSRLDHLIIKEVPLSEINVSQSEDLRYLRLLDTNVTDVDISKNPILCCTYEMGIKKQSSKEIEYSYSNSQMRLSEDILVRSAPANKIDPSFIVDETLRDYILEKYQQTYDGLLDDAEITGIYELELSDVDGTINTFKDLNRMRFDTIVAEDTSLGVIDLNDLPSTCDTLVTIGGKLDDIIFVDNTLRDLTIERTSLDKNFLDLQEQKDIHLLFMYFLPDHDENDPLIIDIRRCPHLVNCYENGTKVAAANKRVSYETENDFICIDDTVKLLTRYDISVTGKNGSVTGGGSFKYNEKVTLSAVPADGFRFLGWYRGDKLVSSDPNWTFDAAEDLKLVAKFTDKKPTPTPTATPTATSTPKVTAVPTSKVTLVPSSAVTPRVTPSSEPSVTTKPVPSSATPKATGKPVIKPTIPAASDPKAQIHAFVERIYTYVLDREPEAEGAAFWSDELYSFRRTGAEVGLGFIFSDEFVNRNLSDEDFVTVLYNTFFGREPEEGGFAFWTGALKDGSLDRAAVANGFIYSQEWADTCARYGIRSGGDIAPSVSIDPTDATYAFVERMYTTAMNRASDEEGAKFWAGELANFRFTGEQVGVMFFLSEEMQNFNLDNKEFVTRLYKTFMDREPEEDGFNFWVGYLADGGSCEGAVLGFTRSEEFVNKCVEARILPY